VSAPVDPIPLLPHEVTVEATGVFVDDVIGGLPIVRFENPAQPDAPIRVRLTAEAARVLSIALGASAAISEVTGWGFTSSSLRVKADPTDRVMQVLARLVDAAIAIPEDGRAMLGMTRGHYPEVFALLDEHLARVGATVAVGGEALLRRARDLTEGCGAPMPVTE
jgi:hypothetical protein